MAYAAQIFVYIHNVLRENVARGLSELQVSGTQIASSLKEYDSNTRVTFADWPAFSTATIRQLIDRWILGDALGQFKGILLAPSCFIRPLQESSSTLRIISIQTIHVSPIHQHRPSRRVGVGFLRGPSLRGLSTRRIFETDLA